MRNRYLAAVSNMNYCMFNVIDMIGATNTIFKTFSQGSAKLEKAEILQMTVDHLKMLHAAGGKGAPGSSFVFTFTHLQT